MNMDIKEAIKNIVSRPFEIETAFYSKKIRSILSMHFQDKNLKRLKVTNKNVIDTIKSHIPEAIVSDFGYYYCLIKLENVDFLINKSGRKKYIRVKGKIDYYIDSIPNLLEYMQDINRLMPEWEKEFSELLVQYANEIKEMELFLCAGIARPPAKNSIKREGNDWLFPENAVYYMGLFSSQT